MQSMSGLVLVCAVRSHGESGAIVRALTEEHGLLAGYVQGARGRVLRCSTAAAICWVSLWQRLLSNGPAR
jgi:recombinational DNA repair protein (RecF pathway)